MRHAIRHEDLSPEYLKSRLHYSPDDGSFIWLPREPKDRIIRMWNTRYAGTQAGNYDSSTGYLHICIDGVKYSASRLAWMYMTGDWPGYCADHTDGIRTNNRWNNLREATQAENTRNKRCHAKSGLKGAFKSPRAGKAKWSSSIMHGGMTRRLGCFDTPEAAHAAYAAAANILHREFARLA